MAKSEENIGGKKRNQELFTSLLPWNSSIETEYLAIKCGRHLSRAAGDNGVSPVRPSTSTRCDADPS